MTPFGDAVDPDVNCRNARLLPETGTPCHESARWRSSDEESRNSGAGSGPNVNPLFEDSPAVNIATGAADETMA